MAYNISGCEWRVLEYESIHGKTIQRKPSIEKKEAKSPGKRKPTVHNSGLSSRSSMGRTSHSPTGKLNASPTTSRSNSPNLRNTLHNTIDASQTINTITGEHEALKQTKKKANIDFSKQLLLDQFTINDPELLKKMTVRSPTTIAMKHSIAAVVFNNPSKETAKLERDMQNTQTSKLDQPTIGILPNMPTIVDGKIWGKRPSARDGHSAHIYKGKLIIFGGDRHRMSLNDFHLYDIEKGLENIRYE